MIPKTELNKRARKARKDSGLKEYRVWIDPSNTEKVNQIKAIDERKGARHETSNNAN